MRLKAKRFVLAAILNTLGTPALSNSWYQGYSPWGEKSKNITVALNDTSSDSGSDDLKTNVHLDLLSEIEVKGERALVGDIVTCEGYEAVCDDLNSIDLGISLGKTDKKILSSSRIEQILKAEGYTGNVSLGGSRSVKIKRKNYLIRGSEIRDRISNILKDNSECGSGCKLELDVSAIYQKFYSLEKDWDIVIHNFDSVVSRIKSVRKGESIKIEWSFSNSKADIQTVFVKPAKLEKAVVYKSSISKGTSLSEDMLIVSWVKSTNIPNAYFEPDFANTNYTLKRSVKAGELVSMANLKAPYIIKSGEVVEVISNSGGLSIKVKGKAMNNAHKGDSITVRVKNKKGFRSQKLVGKARGAGVVEL